MRIYLYFPFKTPLFNHDKVMGDIQESSIYNTVAMEGKPLLGSYHLQKGGDTIYALKCKNIETGHFWL